MVDAGKTEHQGGRVFRGYAAMLGKPGTEVFVGYVPHTTDDVETMLEAVGLEKAADLFSVIPDQLQIGSLPAAVPDALSEPELLREMSAIASRNMGQLICFAGGGAYDSFVPAAVEALASQGEFATAYTPYQPEVSQGVLQALFEYQSLICRLTGMEVANASLYDGASSAVEAANLAAAVTGRTRFVVSEGVAPNTRAVLATFGKGSEYAFEVASLDDGLTRWPAIRDDVAALVVQHPSYIGSIEDVAAAAELAHANEALCIVVTDPLANGILKRPGDLGADVVVGEGQQLGNALSFGGPYLGLFATRMKYLRAVPGRISGETVDLDGRRSYALALQGREQHIRREKASSNICTNQTLMAVAATVALSWLGPTGISRAAELATVNAHDLAEKLASIDGCDLATTAPFFREFVLKVPKPANEVLAGLAEFGFLGGIDLSGHYPEYGDAILVAVTERRTKQEIDSFVEAVQRVAA